MNYLIETTELTKHFRRTDAVENLELRVPEGSVYAFLGANGAGKTTTIKMLMNIIEPTSGSARVLGTLSRSLGPKEFQQIGYVSENQEMPEWMTVKQFINYCAPMYPTWDAAFCDKLLKQFELPLDRKLKNLSRGMKMKASLLSSLAYRPKLLVLDEPFSGLDALVRDEFIRGILELSEQEGWTLFISSHDIDEVERLADWIGVIHEGKLQLSEPVADLQSRVRKIELGLRSDAKVTAPLPQSWIGLEQSGRRMTFIDTQFKEGKSEEMARSIVGELEDWAAHPMSLRETFIGLTRGFKTRR
jgi:ABC-2 type transport system ATP-binding protein